MHIARKILLQFKKQIKHNNYSPLKYVILCKQNVFVFVV